MDFIVEYFEILIIFFCIIFYLNLISVLFYVLNSL